MNSKTKRITEEFRISAMIICSFVQLNAEIHFFPWLFYHFFYSPQLQELIIVGRRKKKVLREPIKMVLLECVWFMRCAWHRTSWNWRHPCGSLFSVIFIALCVRDCMRHCIYGYAAVPNLCEASQSTCVS